MALINCPECQAQISDAATSCPHCGCPVQKAPASNPSPVYKSAPTQTAKPAPVCPDTHMTKAILITLFCCLPFGIAAIVNASEVSSAYMSGNYNLALMKSQNADKWCTWGLVSGAIWVALYILMYVIYGASLFYYL
jgi:hypothetical protein